MRKALAAPAVAIAAAAFPLLTMSTASAAGSSYQATLGQLNDSGVTATAMITLDGSQATVTVQGKGFLADAPHAQHIHAGAAGSCPTAADDKDGDGFVSTTEAKKNYGAIQNSLTVSGDTSASSALAVDRFPTTPGGVEDYSRSFAVNDTVTQSLQNGTAVIVIHGVDKNGSGKYDGDVKSDLDPSLPMEATAPAACGVFAASQMSTMPSGGVNAGDGGTAGVEEKAAIGVGALALTGAAAAGTVAYRRRRADSV